MSVVIATQTMMLTESRSSWGDVVSFDPGKVQRINGDLVGVVGDVGLSLAFFDWYANEKDDDSMARLDRAGEQAIDALVISGDALYWNEGHHPLNMPVYEPVWAVGSGASLALGALFGGASLLVACAVACERNASCGWPIKWYAMDGAEGIVTREDYLAGDYTSRIEPRLFAEPYPGGIRQCPR